ncbi:MAG: diaminopimelate decarboxylase [Synergistaceae bacterium]|jgi:diaminopimelate decarboxylase|nr:diaminopimelate decarboxylase [Synergistaceae bacterium]
MGNFIWGGCDVTELAARFGTPLYVMSEDEITSRIRAVRACFDDRYDSCRTYFASKAFLTKDMLRILMREETGLDVVSGGELYLARAVGFPPEMIMFHGNSKTEAEIGCGLDYGVGCFVVDSAEEMLLIDRMASTRGVRPRILMRVTPGVEGHTHKHIATAGVGSKFGVPMELVRDTVSDGMRLRGASLEGFHFHVGSQLMDNACHMAALNIVLELMKRVRDELGFVAGTLDMGGGFGVAYVEGDAPKPIDSFIRPMTERVEEFCAAEGMPRPFLVVEPGRFIVGPAGITLYAVGSVKEVPDIGLCAGVDGGYPDNPRPALYDAKYAAVAANKCGCASLRRTTIVGKCCESGDVLIRDIDLPELERGDIIAVKCTGAYNHSMSSNYNKNPIPAVVMIKDGEPRLSVRRQSFEDMFAMEI